MEDNTSSSPTPETPRETAALEESPRFQPPKSRRDFLGLAAVWSAVGAFVAAAIGSIRLPMPSVFPESNSKAKIGPPATFSKDSITQIPDLRLWVFRDEQGVYAISSICTHLGCTVARDDETGEFLCPCHGSKFAPDGKVMAGPAPKGLNWLAMSVSPDGQIVVDTARAITAETRLTV